MNTRAGWMLVLPWFALLIACSGEKDEPSADPGMQEESADTSKPPTLGRSASPPGARVFFVNIADGDTVTSPVKLEFGIDGMKVVPAGTDAGNSGHHHVIVDAALPPMDAPIPADANHVHFGDGSTSTELSLPSGEHTLQLLFADYLHIPHEPPLSSERITITVE